MTHTIEETRPADEATVLQQARAFERGLVETHRDLSARFNVLAKEWPPSLELDGVIRELDAIESQFFFDGDFCVAIGAHTTDTCCL